MKKTTLKAIRTHALDCYPAEACGLLLLINGKEAYRPCKNLAPGHDSFVLDPKDFASAEDDGDILMIVHSHPDAAAKPSEADLVMCEETGMPWLILSVYRDLITGEMVAEDYTITKPTGYEAPLVGRMWYPPTSDCYTLIRDWYSRNLGIPLLNFEVEKRATTWWDDANTSSLYMDNFEEAGFLRVDDGPKEHDVILMEIGSKAGPNHAAVYLGDETGYMLHHLYSRLSSRAVYGGYWLDHTRMVVRHKDLM